MEFAVILTIAAIVVFSLGTYILKKFRFKKLLILLQSQQFDQFDELVDKFSTRYLFPRFNLEYLKMNSNILRIDEKKIDESFTTLFSMKMSKAQKEDVYMKAFNYYVGIEDANKTKEIIAVIEEFDNAAMKKEARTIYDIFILKRSNYIEEMEAALDEQDNDEKGINEYLLSVQYKNKGDKKKSKEYLELSKKHLNPKDV